MDEARSSLPQGFESPTCAAEMAKALRAMERKMFKRAEEFEFEQAESARDQFTFFKASQWGAGGGVTI